MGLSLSKESYTVIPALAGDIDYALFITLVSF